MAREVNDVQPFVDKLVKLVPTEIVGTYLAILGITAPASNSKDKISEYTLVFVFVFLLILTPLYLWKITGVTNRVQLIVSTVSYVIWVYTLAYPFQFWGWYHPMIGAVVLILWSVITPFFVTPTEPTPDPPVDPAPPNDN